MGSKWKTSFLTDHYSISSGLSKPAKDFGTGYPFLSFKDIFYNYFLPDSLTQLVQSSDKERASCSVRRGDVFLTRTSETMHELGMSSVALKDYTDTTFNGFCKRLRPKETSELEPEYVGYYLRSHVFRQSMLAFSTMSTRASLNNEMISRLEIRYPDRRIQKQIANILLSLDEKIAISRAINQTLEKMSQTLFKSWFVDFDPVIDNALDAGNPIPEALQSRAELRQKVRNSAEFKPLPADVCALFPAEFEETEQGCVPKGWLLESVAKSININPTIRLPKNTVAKYVDMKSLPTQGYSISDIIEKPYSGGAKFQKNDTLFARITPCLENGKTGFVDFLDENETAFGSTEFIVMRGTTKVHHTYVACLARENHFRLHAIQNMVGSSGRQRVQNSCFDSFFIAIPSPSVMSLFAGKVSIFFDKMNCCNLENKALTNLRDTLLPKLISGELSLEDLPDLIKQTEAA